LNVDYLRWGLGGVTTLLGVTPLLVRLRRRLGIVPTLPTVVLAVTSRGRGHLRWIVLVVVTFGLVVEVVSGHGGRKGGDLRKTAATDGL